MQLDFTGKRVLVTGGTRGIGRGAVEGFHELGARVAVNGRTAEGVAKAIEEIGGGDRLVPAPGDLSAVAGCKAVVEKAIAQLGGLDVLVNSAGRGDDRMIDDVDEDYWEMMLSLNLKGAFFCIRFAVPALRASKGSVINVASVLGVIGGPDGTTVYSTTKGGLVNMTRALALELAEEGVRVNSLCPGFIDTDMIRGENELAGDDRLYKFIDAWTPLGRIGTVNECAGAILYLASENAGYTTGATLVNDGGVSSGH